MARALTPISVVALGICADLGDSNGRYKFTILRHLLAGWREWNLYVGQEFCVKTQVLAVDNVIELPSDFIYETKVGLRRNGRIAMLTLDKSIEKHTFSQDESGVKLNEIWNGGVWGGEYTFYNYSFNNGLGELYGYGGVINTNGYYNIDRGKGEIYIGSLTPDDAEIVIEYKSSGEDDGLTLIPTETVKCLEYYAKSEWYGDRDLGKAQYNRANYEREYRKLKLLYNYRTALFMANQAQSMYESAPR